LGGLKTRKMTARKASIKKGGGRKPTTKASRLKKIRACGPTSLWGPGRAKNQGARMGTHMYAHGGKRVSTEWLPKCRRQCEVFTGWAKSGRG